MEPPPLPAVRAFALVLAPLTALTVAACRRGAEAPPAPGPGATASEAAYLAPPRPLAAMGLPDGEMRVLGRAAPRSRVEITSAEGERRAATADAAGAWSVRLPVATANLYAISATPPGQPMVHAEGALLTVPGAPASAVMVRAGYAALPLNPTPASAISTVDYDPGGSVAIAGVAAPRAQLTLSVDGAAAGTGQADEQGLYALMAANRRLSLGPHVLKVSGPGGAAQRQVILEPPVALSEPYRAWLEPDGWRVEWALNGGGVQTTLILNR